MLKLRELRYEDKDSILEFRNAFRGENAKFPMEGLANFRVIFDYDIWFNRREKHIDEFTNSNNYKEYTYILIDENNHIYGACNIRYPLADNLINLGGNIGYAIRPDDRGKGYGEKLLRLSMDKCREFGMDKMLITARVENDQSNGLIKKCGGVQDRDYLDPDSGILFHRYWIKL